MKKKLLLIVAVLLAAALLIGGVLLWNGARSSDPAAKLSPRNPQLLTLWHYYNGAHQQAFDDLILQFNETVGLEKGIIIEAKSHGSVGSLTKQLIASAKGEFGADPMPDIFAAYADMAWDVSKIRPLADLRPYFTEAELSAYIAPYINEGYLSGSDRLSVFPIAKSTEVLMLNRTEWYLFASATGADTAMLSTWEGIAELSRMYWEWTDSLTPDVPDDGRAFFGLDAYANYLIISSQQLGVEMFQVDDSGKVTLTIDEAAMRRVWDTFVVPSANGWYAAYGAYRTDDVKTGRLAALVGSTSGAVYFPTTVTREDGTAYAITGECLPVPVYEGATPCTVQQGAGMAVTAGDPVREYAAAVFLKWFTQEANNIDFSIATGYLPVKTAANELPRLEKALDAAGITGMLRDGLLTSAEMTATYALYTTPVFDGCYAAREAVNDAMSAVISDVMAQRDQLIQSGLSRAEAIARATDDAAFTAWVNRLRTDVNAILQ